MGHGSITNNDMGNPDGPTNREETGLKFYQQAIAGIGLFFAINAPQCGTALQKGCTNPQDTQTQTAPAKAPKPQMGLWEQAVEETRTAFRNATKPPKLP